MAIYITVIKVSSVFLMEFGQHFPFPKDRPANPNRYASSFGSNVLVFNVSVCFKPEPKVKLLEALYGINTFRYPRNFW